MTRQVKGPSLLLFITFEDNINPARISQNFLYEAVDTLQKPQKQSVEYTIE